MTTGSRSFGSSAPVTTGAGPGWVYKDFGSKTWSGGDQGVPLPPLPDVINRRPRLIDALYGREVVDVPLTPPKLRLPSLERSRKGPKRRSAYDEHPYSMTTSKLTDSVYTVGSRFGQITQTSEQGGGGLGSSSTGWSSSNEVQLLSRLRDRVAGTGFNAGVFLGEGREALGMIFNAANRITQAAFAAKRGNFGYAARALIRGTDRAAVFRGRTPAESWLGLQYGWLPLLRDAYDGAGFLGHILNTPLQQVVRVSSKSSGFARASASTPGNGWKYKLSRCEQSVHLKCVLREKDFYKLSGLTDPLSVAWELVPFSFVFDWFIPIGTYLQNRGLASSLEGTFVRSERRFWEVKDPILDSNGRSWIVGATQPSYHFRRVQISRTVSSTLQVPQPQVVPLSEAFSWKRAASAVSLVTVLSTKVDSSWRIPQLG